MAFRICLCMNTTRMQTAVIVLTATLHDIGKVGVTDSILRKEGRLTNAEWQEIQRHPVIGAQVLLKSDGLEQVADGVRHHHERWDGKGYPDGLRGGSIPLSARVIAVCDSIDAMRTDRPYRKAYSALRS